MRNQNLFNLKENQRKLPGVCHMTCASRQPSGYGTIGGGMTIGHAHRRFSVQSKPPFESSYGRVVTSGSKTAASLSCSIQVDAAPRCSRAQRRRFPHT